MSIGGLECGVFPVSNDYIFLRKQDEHGNRTNPFSSAHIPGRAKGPENGECAEWASKSIRQTALLLVACVNSVGKGLCLRGGQFRVERPERGRLTGANPQPQLLGNPASVWQAKRHPAPSTGVLSRVLPGLQVQGNRPKEVALTRGHCWVGEGQPCPPGYSCGF